MVPDMKDDWNLRARENARYYVAPSHADDDATFDQSGSQDVELFFQGLDPLLDKDVTVLDLGCGIGRMDQCIAGRVGELIGIDVSGEMLARARLAEVSNVEFVEGDGWTLGPIGAESIDVVFSHIVFQHVSREVVSSYFGEVIRVLRPGGHFVFQMPEANAQSPADPTDTFALRFDEEAALRDELLALGFDWMGCVRHPVRSPRFDFSQMRIHVTRPE